MFDLYESNTELKIKLSARLDYIDQADDLLARYLAEKHIPVDVFKVRMLLRESLLNAVTHGSGNDSQKVVCFELVVGSQGVKMTVWDEGPGFNWQGRESSEEKLAESGRGLSLMKIYSDTMTYNEKGNRITLEKQFISKPMVEDELILKSEVSHDD